MNKSHAGLTVGSDCVHGTPFVEFSPCLYSVDVPESVVVFGSGHHEYGIVKSFVGDSTDMEYIVLFGGVDESLQFRGSLL